MKTKVFPCASTPSIHVIDWKDGMMLFMGRHIKQLKGYTKMEMDVVHDRLRRFQCGAGLPTRTMQDPIHANAVCEVSKLFACRTFDGMNMAVVALVNHYAKNGKQKEFEEIAFVFSVLANEPTIMY